MTKELFVSSTPHETKVGLVEDDQLAEVYLERENEYTLAGSIYKGRVTRVLPGMQSAFVDIGLERDAFLYVSDFMELENQEDDLDEIPTARAVPEFNAAPQVSEATQETGFESEPQPQPVSESQAATTAARETLAPREDRGRGDFRGRRRRGRRDRGPEPRFSRPAPVESRPERDQYGPPAGYQPIILPGESISKYRGLAQSPAPAREAISPVEESHTAIFENFPQDEPLFAEAALAGDTEQAESRNATSSTGEDAPATTLNEEASAIDYGATGVPARSEKQQEARNFEASSKQSHVGSSQWDEQKRLHEMNVAAVFGGEEAEDDSEEPESVQAEPPVAPIQTAPGTMEEEEIDEEEADIASYVEELEEDAAFDEFEEETHAAGENVESSQEIAASADNSNVVPFSSEPVSLEIAEVAQAEEVDEATADEAELEEAQAEAEALLDAEGRGNGTLDARAEVGAPAATAAYTQRAPRPGYDRDRSRRGGFRRGGGGGGRRLRRQETQNLPQITDLLKEGQE